MHVLFVFQSNLQPRTGIMYLSSELKAEGHEIRFEDARRLGLDGLRKVIKEWAPSVVGYPVMTGEHLRLLSLNRALKEDFSFISVFGGPHATFAAEELIADPGCDAVCVGEGDVAFPEFCRRLAAGEAWWESPNFLARRDGAIHRNPLLPLVAELDALPMPDHDLMYAADPELAREGVKYFYSSRGCPYECAYCFHHEYNQMYKGKGPTVQHTQPGKLIEEIAYVKAHYPLTGVALNDDEFLMKPKGWFEDFCAQYKERIGLPIVCCVRANFVTDHVIGLLRDAGLVMAALGVECGNETAANEILKRNLSRAQLVEAGKIIKKHGVKLVTLSLCGLPVEDKWTLDLETLDLNIELAPTFAYSSILYPYPGTQIRQYALEHGYLPNNEVPVRETTKSSSVFSFRSESEKRRVENLHKLFDVMVHYPWLRKHVDFICSLPLGILYRAIWYVRYGYMWKFKTFRFSSLRKELWVYLIHFLRMLRQK